MAERSRALGHLESSATANGPSPSVLYGPSDLVGWHPIGRVKHVGAGARDTLHTASSIVAILRGIPSSDGPPLPERREKDPPNANRLAAKLEYQFVKGTERLREAVSGGSLLAHATGRP